MDQNQNGEQIPADEAAFCLGSNIYHLDWLEVSILK